MRGGNDRLRSIGPTTLGDTMPEAQAAAREKAAKDAEPASPLATEILFDKAVYRLLMQVYGASPDMQVKHAQALSALCAARENYLHPRRPRR